MEPVFPLHLIKLSIIIDHQSKLYDRLFSMIDYEKSNNRTTLVNRLASHPLVRMHPKKDQSNQRKRAKMINQ